MPGMRYASMVVMSANSTAARLEKHSILTNSGAFTAKFVLFTVVSGGLSGCQSDFPASVTASTTCNIVW